MRYAGRTLGSAVPALVAAFLLCSCGSSGGGLDMPSQSGLPATVPATTEAATAGSATAATPGSSVPASGTGSSAAITTITCAPARSARPAPAALRGTLAQLRARAAKVGIDARISLRADGSFRIVVLRSGTVAPAQLCANAEIAFRPVILAASAPTGAAHGNPLARLGFAPPRDAAAYLRMPAAHRRALEAALRSARCAGLRAGTGAGPVLACDSDGHAYLLAAPLFDGSQVTDAHAAGPNEGSGVPDWAVQIEVDARARTAVANYTSAHNFGNGAGPSQPADACDNRAVPCANFIAVVIDGSVWSAPATASPVRGGAIQITGTFTAGTATALAARLQTPLTVPLHVIANTGSTAGPRPSAS